MNIPFPATLSGWNFDNSYTRLPNRLFSSVEPVPVTAPAMVLFNEALAEELGLRTTQDQESDSSAESREMVLAGNRLPEGSEPIAQAYAGHQFGHFTMLGDGRAILLGEQVTPRDHRFDVQFKGSGRTPYSRGGDGRATLRSMLREYLISEAVHALGIPSSRSLAVVRTGDPVYREEIHEGAILTRISSSHLRVGTFEYARHALSPDEMITLIRYALERHDPDLAGSETPAEDLLRRVLQRQAELVTDWMRVGFIHGVMNTDNMSVAGETFDYGPCAFMNSFDPATVFSSIDTHGRYAFGNQPKIAHWNLSRLAGALLPAISRDEEKAVEKATEILNLFPETFEKVWLKMMGRKFGFPELPASDRPWVDRFLQKLMEIRADYTNSFLLLQGDLRDTSLLFSFGATEESVHAFQQLREEWNQKREEAGISADEARKRMRRVNPAVIPRNYLVEEALERATKERNMDLFYELLDVVRRPYSFDGDPTPWQKPPADGDQGYKTFCGT